MELPATGHDPVLLAEVLSGLGAGPGKTYVDCTLGRGGHALAIGELLGPTGLLVGLDADERNLNYAADRLSGLTCQRRLFHANFADLAEVLGEVGLKTVDLILADLGVSTNQLFQSEYGMSISVAGELDMRLDRSRGTSAADIVNRWPEEKIANVLYDNADERFSRRIARKITAERRASPILTTDRLADVVRAAIGGRSDPDGIDPATRTFQALRMEANREVPNLERLLQRAPGFLAPAGRLGVISFHSGEDRLVKQAMRLLDGAGGYHVLTKKPLAPSEDEVRSNPRSRSAKLRILEAKV
jgi:16S rRNA (cytosine1402-N4)-methyltransferase